MSTPEDTLVRLAHRLLGGRDVAQLLRALLETASASLPIRAAAAYGYDPSNGRFDVIARQPETSEPPASVDAERRAPTDDGWLTRPLCRNRVLYGALALAPASSLASADVKLVEAMVDLAGDAIAWFEDVRLEGALLAARTAEHEVNNRLVATTAYAQLMLRDPAFPTHLRERAEAVLKGAREAALIVRRLRELAEIRETRWGADPLLSTIDLSASPTRDH